MADFMLASHGNLVEPSHSHLTNRAIASTAICLITDLFKSLNSSPSGVPPFKSDNVAFGNHDGWCRHEMGIRRRILCARMATAETRAAWEAAAHELDTIEGNGAWKRDDATPVSCAADEKDYEPELIAQRLLELDQARAAGDVEAMLRVVRSCYSRDFGGVGNAELYRHCHVGTKHLVDRYVHSSLQTIDAIARQATIRYGPVAAMTDPNHVGQKRHSLSRPAGGGITAQAILEELLCARQTFGRSALLLSGGGTFGMAHIGVVKSLFEASLLPRIISGASAGSIVCAVLCTRTDAEIPQLLRDFPYGDLSVFSDPAAPGKSGFFDHLRTLLTQGTWSNISHLSRVMREMLGDLTFQEAYNRTRRILNICVSSAGIYELPRLLNYVTAPSVLIWSAVAASCSVPLVFGAAPLMAKDSRTGAQTYWDSTPQSSWIDGSVDNDLPMSHLSEMFNVNHFIVSQVNPHVAPFLSRDDGNVDPSATISRSSQPSAKLGSWKSSMAYLARDEVLHRLHFMTELGVFPNLMTKVRSVLSQKYSGDINILPSLALSDLPLILSNPTREFMLRVCLLGERATWPKLSRIRDRCAIELALDRAVHRVRALMLFMPQAHQITVQPVVEQPSSSLVDVAPADRRYPSSAAGETWPRRQRRRSSSGCNSSMFARGDDLGSSATGEQVLTDSDTDEDERGSALSRRHGPDPTCGVTINRRRHRVRLKRVFKSHLNLGCLSASHRSLAPVTAPLNGQSDSFEDRHEFAFHRPATMQPPLIDSTSICLTHVRFQPNPVRVDDERPKDGPNGSSAGMPS